MKCLLLGAGYATRLYPLTRERPKPLLPIGGVPILQRICEAVYRVPEVDRIYVVSNHRFVQHYYNWLAELGRTPKPIEIFDDLTHSPDDRLGAVGDMDFVVRHAKIDDDLLVVAGDNLFQFDLAKFARFSRQKGSAVAVKDIGSREKASLYGVIAVDAGRRVVEFEEKPPVPSSTLISIGVYCYAKAHVPFIRKYLADGHNKDQPGHYVQWLHTQIPLYAYPVEGEWYDIGDIDSYSKANELYLTESGSQRRPRPKKRKVRK